MYFLASFAKCRDHFGSAADVVLNCAAAIGEQNWERIYDVNVVRINSDRLTDYQITSIQNAYITERSSSRYRSSL